MSYKAMTHEQSGLVGNAHSMADRAECCLNALGHDRLEDSI